MQQSLHERPRQVVALAVEGLTAKQIGHRLYISERTVETHLARAYAKHDVHTRRPVLPAAKTPPGSARDDRE